MKIGKRLIFFIFFSLSFFYVAFWTDVTEEYYVPKPQKEAEWINMPLWRKAADYDETAKKYHLPKPQNLVVSIRFKDGEIMGREGVGDAPIWTACYLAAQAHRYAVTKDDDALQSVRAALEGIESLFAVTGERGLMARYYFFRGEHDRADLLEGRGKYANFAYLDDISRDQYIGVVFGLGAAYELVPAEEQKRIGILLGDIIFYLEKHDWRILNAQGKQTTGGILHPHSFFGVGNAVHVLSFAKAHSQADQDGKSQYEDYVKKYNDELENIFPWINRHYDYYAVNLYYLSFFNLIRLEKDPALKAFYRDVFEKRLWFFTKNHDNVFFNYIHAAISGQEMNLADRNDNILLLRRFPLAPRRDFRVVNSRRTDIPKMRNWRGVVTNEQNTQFSRHPLPIHERPPSDFLWQRTPFALDGGGDGNLEYSGVDFLLAYWMGRYYGLIDAGD